MFDLFCCSRGRDKKHEKRNPLLSKKIEKNDAPVAVDEKVHERQIRDQKRNCCTGSELRNTSGLLTAAAGITLIVTSGGVAAPIVAGSLTTTAGVVQIIDANLK